MLHDKASVLTGHCCSIMVKMVLGLPDEFLKEAFENSDVILDALFAMAQNITTISEAKLREMLCGIESFSRNTQSQDLSKTINRHNDATSTILIHRNSIPHLPTSNTGLLSSHCMGRKIE